MQFTFQKNLFFRQRKIKITQIKSQIGYKEKAKLTLKALGLRKMHQTIIKEDLPEQYYRQLIKSLYLEFRKETTIKKIDKKCK